MEQYRNVVSETNQRISNKLPGVKNLMGLYLANAETEAILFRPIRSQIMAQFALLRKHIDKLEDEDRFIINCPSPEQLTLTMAY
jgi:conserved oligomeric Golgi complex subunit 3